VTFRQGIAYVLRHAWLWPLEFWLRPLDVIDRNRNTQQDWAEFSCSLVGGAAWGAAIGILLWLWSGDAQAIWTIAGAFAGAGAGAGAGAVFSTIGIAIGIWLPGLSLFLGLSTNFIFLVLIIWLILSNIKSGLNFPDWAMSVFISILLIGVPIANFSFFPRSELNQIPIWGTSLVIASTIGILAGFYKEVAKKNNLHLTKASQTEWLATFWSFFPLLALAAWLPKPSTPGLNAKLDLLAIFFALAPPLFTGLIAWPLTGLIALRQFRTSRAPQYTAQGFALTLPLRWQTFAYPLPGLRRYLAKLCSEHGPEVAFNAIQTIQLRSLQMHAARRAALDLATDPDTALPFCGQVAITTNAATLVPLSLAGPIARAVAALAATQEKENEQPLQLYVVEFPPRRPTLPFLSRVETPSWIESFQTTRQRGLPERLDFAIREIESCPPNPDLTEFRALLEALSNYAHTNSIQSFQSRSLLGSVVTR